MYHLTTMDVSLSVQSQLLLEKVAKQCITNQPCGSMSSSIYDTAWVSMIQKSGTWLFPKCFDFILKTQLSTGAWTSYATETDGILNTAASLLALKKHLRELPCGVKQDLVARSQRAELALKLMLKNWDLGHADQVGFEILVVKHLALLEDEGISFDYSGLTTLRALYNDKVYDGKSTLFHSLEALIGRIYFDQIKHCLEENGSMLNSPSSTAAYLMYSSVWDNEAESYLENALLHGTGKEDGSVPCAWPTTVFDVSWVVATLAEAGVILERGGSDAITIGSFLERTLVSHNGVVGFAPSILPDADDTAKALAALRYLGRSSSVVPLLETFNAKGHFQTYQGERNPSFSANCNILICLLMQDDPISHAAEIAKAVTFLCDQVFDGRVKEKWHIHQLYWMMLLSQAFLRFYARSKGEGLVLSKFVFAQEPKLRQYIPMISLQILTKTLNSQNENGSWDNLCEVTAYAVLTLSSIAQLPWIYQLHDDRISVAISEGKLFLQRHRDMWDKGNYLWVEKVTYASDLLSEAYCLAASMTQVTTDQPEVHQAFALPAEILNGTKKATNLIRQTKLLVHTPLQVLRISELLASYSCLWSSQNPPPDIFTRSGKESSHKYLIFTPVIWTACNIVHGSPLSLSALCEMITFSIVIYQVDEFMETVIKRDFGHNFSLANLMIKEICQMSSSSIPETRMDEQAATWVSKGLHNVDHVAYENAKAILGRYIDYVLGHKAVLTHPKIIQLTLAQKLEIFLMAHVTQEMDNKLLALYHNTDISTDGHPSLTPTPLKFPSSGRTFFDWVRNTSADHTSCPFAFIFYICLVSKPPSGPFKTAKSAYLAEDLSRHLASLCRMYNDYGSVTRDRDEGNLNSVNFPEFHVGLYGTQDDDEQNREESIKDQLMCIAEYERGGLQRAIKLLEEDIGNEGLMKALKVFIDVTDLYGQIYILRDLTSRNKYPEKAKPDISLKDI